MKALSAMCSLFRAPGPESKRCCSFSCKEMAITCAKGGVRQLRKKRSTVRRGAIWPPENDAITKWKYWAIKMLKNTKCIR